MGDVDSGVQQQVKKLTNLVIVIRSHMFLFTFPFSSGWLLASFDKKSIAKLAVYQVVWKPNWSFVSNSQWIAVKNVMYL